jgi:signal transduction histidine kinase
VASFTGANVETHARIGPVRSGAPVHSVVEARPERLELIHAILAEGALDHVRPLLGAAYERASRVVEAAGASGASRALAASVYASDVVVALAAEGELEPSDTRAVASALALARDEPFAAAAFDLYLRAVSSPSLLELPPVVAASLQLRFLLDLDIALDASIWRRTGESRVECILALGAQTQSRQVRATARAAITGRFGLSLVGTSNLRFAQIRRFGEPAGAVVIRVYGDPSRDVNAYLECAAVALSPLLEREQLLERDAARERALVGASEKRLMRLGFDLHDGPIQDVLALVGETARLRDQVYPFVLESHRELAYGRFGDMLARLADLDRSLREVAHSLETKSIVSRPLSEILHREVEGFATRSGITATVEVRGDPESLSSAQKVAIFRAVQESLANVREHSGATAVEVAIRSRRSSIDVRVTDNGHGFEVSRSLAKAAQRGRLGIVGIGERVRMLGGTFEIDSRPGGPTSLRFSLPRWKPFSAVDGPRM